MSDDRINLVVSDASPGRLASSLTKSSGPNLIALGQGEAIGTSRSLPQVRGDAVEEHRVTSGWHAELALRFARGRERTVLAARHQRGPLTVQRPFYPESDGVCHTYLLHPPAGIVGGDDLQMSFEVGAGAHALLTTPAATRWYFSRGATAHLGQRAELAAGATLEWLPQENLFFNGARARLRTRVDLAAGARFLGWEVLGFGRPACGESFDNGRLEFGFEIFRDGRPLLIERLRSASGGVPGLRGHAACATFLATPASREALDQARAVLQTVPQAICGATLIGDLLAIRGLAPHCDPLKSAFLKLWSALRPCILKRDAAAPRIWST